MSILREAWASRYVGIPFAESGFDLAGCNCWGLVHLVLKTEWGIETPTYGEISADELLATCRAFRTSVRNDPWREVVRSELNPFDCVLMTAMDQRGHRSEGHVGIVASDNGSLKVLHVWRATAACLMPLDHPRIRPRIVGFYRHRDLVA
jgi:hypothetical protein